MKRSIIGLMLLLTLVLCPCLKGHAITRDEQNNIEIYQMASPAVVNITSVVLAYDFFHRPIPQKGTGSGTIIDQRGHIVTNQHVIQNAEALEVTLADGSRLPARVVASDPENDLAVIKIEVPLKGLKKIPLGSSKELRVGQKVLAIGNPFGLGQTLTTGIISSLGRSIRTESGAVIHDVVQTDAAINPGNSGGPLLNSRGEMIGINTAILSTSTGSAGVGFAIPVDTVKRILPRLIAGGRFSYRLGPYLFYALLVYLMFLLWRKMKMLKKAPPGKWGAGKGDQSPRSGGI